MTPLLRYVGVRNLIHNAHRSEKSSQLINLNVCQLRNDIIQSLGQSSGGLNLQNMSNGGGGVGVVYGDA